MLRQIKIADNLQIRIRKKRARNSCMKHDLAGWLTTVRMTSHVRHQWRVVVVVATAAGCKVACQERVARAYSSTRCRSVIPCCLPMSSGGSVKPRMARRCCCWAVHFCRQSQCLLNDLLESVLSDDRLLSDWVYSSVDNFVVGSESVTVSQFRVEPEVLGRSRLLVFTDFWPCTNWLLFLVPFLLSPLSPFNWIQNTWPRMAILC